MTMSQTNPDMIHPGLVAAMTTNTVLESLLLSVAHYWSYRETRDRQVELLDRHFRQDEMFHALLDLRVCKLLTPPIKRQHTANKTATKAQAEDVVDTLKELGDADNLPRFMVQSDDLPRVAPLLGAVSVGDERGVSARLEALEQSHRLGLEKMDRMMASVMRGAYQQPTSTTASHEQCSGAPGPQVIVTPPPPASFSAVAARRTRNPGPGMTQGQSQATQGGAGPQQPFFDRGRKENGLQAGQGRQPRQDRSSSAGKRQRMDEEGGWQEQRPYRSSGRQMRSSQPRTQVVVKGSSGEFTDLAEPVTWWVGKCHPDTTEDKVKEVLKKCANNLGISDFAIENVHNLTKDPNPWSRSFKVTVPARLREQMSNPGMYPAGWESRAFTRWLSRQQQAPPAGRRAQEGSPVAPQLQETSVAPQLQENSVAPQLQQGSVTPGQDSSLESERVAGEEALLAEDTAQTGGW